MLTCGDTGSPSGSRSRPCSGRGCATAPSPRPSGGWRTRPGAGSRPPRAGASPPTPLKQPTRRGKRPEKVNLRRARPARASGRLPSRRHRLPTWLPNCGCLPGRSPSHPFPFSWSPQPATGPVPKRHISPHAPRAATSSRRTASSAASPVNGCHSAACSHPLTRRDLPLVENACLIARRPADHRRVRPRSALTAATTARWSDSQHP